MININRIGEFQVLCHKHCLSGQVMTEKNEFSMFYILHEIHGRVKILEQLWYGLLKMKK